MSNKPTVLALCENEGSVYSYGKIVRFIIITSQLNRLLNNYLARASLLSVAYFKDLAFHIISLPATTRAYNKIFVKLSLSLKPSSVQILGTISAFAIFPGTLFSAPSKLALSYSNWPKSKTAETQRHMASIYPALNPNA